MSIGLDVDKETKKDYLKGKIVRLECQQLAESIISIKRLYNPSRRVGISGRTEDVKRIRPKLNYVITFDAAIKVSPITVNAKTLRALNKYRMILFPKISHTPNEAKALNAKTKSLKQITSLLDEEILEREINFKKYNLCHYCKFVKPLEQLVRCKSGNLRTDTSFKIIITTPKNKKHRYISNLKKDNKKGCCRLFCKGCLTMYLDFDAKSIENDSWICPCCYIDSEYNLKGNCDCSRCMREQKILKYRREFSLEGGLDSDIKKPIELLSKYAEDNFNFLMKKVIFF